MSRTLKKCVYRGAQWLGLFRLARRLTAKQLRILGYHGFATGDEVEFRPQLFMDVREFRWRINHLLRHAYPVLSLDDALDRLRRSDLPACAVVLTFDDGAYSTWKLAAPLLQEHRLPATIYLTTYYCVKPNPVFRIAVQYMFWKTSKNELSLAGLGLDGNGVLRFPDAASKEQAMWTVINQAESRFHEAERVALCAELGRRLDMDYAEIARTRPFSLMTADEVRQAADAGVDIQLHTHRHRLPDEPDQARAEVEENRRTIVSLTGRQPRHFCYPSGIYSEARRQALAAAGVISAATCDAGLNDAQTPALALRRFMDGSNISRIEFEAELSGFSEVSRRIRSVFSRRRQ
jgi:peptidoglycan/xylan/chitin deacetylase (PgdA/CDA1 family)